MRDVRKVRIYFVNYMSRIVVEVKISRGKFCWYMICLMSKINYIQSLLFNSRQSLVDRIRAG